MWDIYNEQSWSKPQVIAEYTDVYSLQFPEIMIFLKYKEEICGKNVVDIGCGGGRTSYILKNIAGSYMGVDRSREMISVCKQKIGEKYFRQADARDMSFINDSSVDFAIFSFNGLDCINHEDRLKALREIHRVLKPQKLFIFSAHNRNWQSMHRKPHLRKALNPIRQILELYRYIFMLARYRRNKEKEFFCPEYAIIRDQDQGFAILYYYIGKKEQITQAGSAGFRIIEMYDIFGNLLREDSDDSHSAWIYYVARKIEGVQGDA